MMTPKLPLLALIATCALTGAASGAAPIRDTPPPAAIGPVFCEPQGAACALRATNAPIAVIGEALGRATRCAVEVDPALRDRRVTIDLAARPADRLARALAREVPARLSVRFLLKPAARPAAPPSPDRERFARQPLRLETRRSARLSDVIPLLGIPVEAPDVLRDAPVRVYSVRRPLSRVLDQIAAQVGAEWEVVLRLDAVNAADGDSAAYERMHAHFADLAALPAAERQEELVLELQSIRKRPGPEREERVRRLAADVLSLATLLQSVPGEHRDQMAPRVLALARDYQKVLSRLTGEQSDLFAPVLLAADELEQRLAETR
jgi:hypothetical protein